jgi:CRP-like cAMP-binding protein
MTTPAAASERGLLRSVSIFAHLDEGGATELERLAEARDYPAGAVIASQQERGDTLFVLVRGKVKAILYGESGREVILSIFKSPGDFFGELSLLDGEPRSATLVADAPSRLLVLSRDAFQRHLKRTPATALRVLEEVSKRLRRADEVIGNLALLDVFARVAGKLRELALAEGEPVADGLLVRERPTQAEMAAMIGTSRETVSRVLSELSRAGHVALAGKRLLVRRTLLEGVAR